MPSAHARDRPIRDPEATDFPTPADVDDPIDRIEVLPAPPLVETGHPLVVLGGFAVIIGAFWAVSGIIEAIRPGSSDGLGYLVIAAFVVFLTHQLISGCYADRSLPFERIAFEIDVSRELRVVARSAERDDLAPIR